jgi:hypothetical protein
MSAAESNGSGAAEVAFATAGFAAVLAAVLVAVVAEAPGFSSGVAAKAVQMAAIGATPIAMIPKRDKVRIVILAPFLISRCVYPPRATALWQPSPPF